MSSNKNNSPGKNITIALAGNPNSGKTTLFNAITGARQHVGNYPGVTVEKKEGKCKFQDKELNIVDLPGTYSLTAYSIEELVARNYIINEKPDSVINVVDASNIERNLYLATQLIELETPLVIALNMMDVAKSRGYNIDIELLSNLLKTPVITTIASKEEGINNALEKAIEVSRKPDNRKSLIIKYDKEIEEQLEKLTDLIKKENFLTEKYPPRWLAIKLLENDTEIIKELKDNYKNYEEITTISEVSRSYIENFFNEEPEFIISDRRYGFVNGACKESVRQTQEDKITSSDRIDLILTNRILGIPIFIFFMWLVFHLTFTIGNYPVEWIEAFFNLLSKLIGSIIPSGIIKSILVDGVIGGVGSVIVFLPNILLLFLAIAILEDTGYMARVAFIMDRLMHLIGLHGRAFIPMLIGFGCSVPAVMATRTLDNNKNRLTTIMIIPFMSCSAKLPVYTLLTGTFFPPHIAGTVLFSIYITGILLAIIMAKILSRYLSPEENSFFIMELPPYRIPTLKSVFLHMWERAKLYLQKAGTVILTFSVLIWFLTNYPGNVNYSRNYKEEIDKGKQNFRIKCKSLAEDLNISIKDPEKNSKFRSFTGKLEDIQKNTEDETEKHIKLEILKHTNPSMYELSNEYLKLLKRIDECENNMKSEKIASSYAGRIGKFMEPLIKPLGFNWKIGMSLITGFAAKEVVVSTLGTIYSSGEEEGSAALRESLRKDINFTPLVAYAFMIFVLIYVPCIAATTIISKETSILWTIFMVFYTTAIAWLMAFIIYQGGRLLGL